MAYWIFKANPEKYRIDARLLDPNPNITWAVTRYHDRIQKGDTVFVWRGAAPRGVCAIMLVEACPYQPQHEEIYDGYELPPGEVNPLAPHWAKCVLTRRFPLVEASVIKKIPGLELFSFFSAFQQATNFSITRPEGVRLNEFIENRPPEELVAKREALVRPAAAPKVRAVGAKTTRPAAGSSLAHTAAELLKCEECGRFVVSSDTDRHIRENHAGLPVGWKKVK